jgi:hypothetical protein
MEEVISTVHPSATSDPEPEEVSDAELADGIIDGEQALEGEGAKKMRWSAGRLGEWKCRRRCS